MSWRAFHFMARTAKLSKPSLWLRFLAGAADAGKAASVAAAAAVETKARRDSGEVFMGRSLAKALAGAKRRVRTG
jgi:hypothetical protein